MCIYIYIYVGVRTHDAHDLYDRGKDDLLHGRRVKPVKPRETRDETTWQACETSETGRNNII